MPWLVTNLKCGNKHLLRKRILSSVKVQNAVFTLHFFVQGKLHMKFNNKQLNRCFYVFAKEIFQKICGAKFGIFCPLSLSSGMNLSNFIEIFDVIICHNDDPEKRFVFNSLDCQLSMLWIFMECRLLWITELSSCGIESFSGIRIANCLLFITYLLYSWTILHSAL